VIGVAAVSYLMVTAAVAAERFVAQQDPKASDDNPGTEAAPFKTIVAALKGLTSGDTVFIKKGVYREVVFLTPNGRDKCPPVPSGKSYQQMTSVAAFPGDEVIVKGSDVITGWKHHKDQIWYTENAPKPTALPILFCDDKRLNIIGDWGGRMSEMIKGMAGSVEVWKGRKGQKLEELEANSYFYDISTNRLYVWLADGTDPNKHQIELTMRSGLSIDGSYLRVSGIRFLQASAGVGGRFNILENCESSDSAWCGGGVYGEFNTLIGCKFNRNGDSGMGGSGRGHRIINCETSYNNFLRIDAGWHSGGCKFIPFCSDIVMSGHTAAYNIECPGIWFDWGNFNITVENSVVHHNGSGIMYEVSERGTFRNNVCYENYGRGIYLSNSPDCQVLNNVFYHNGMSGLAAIGVSRGGGDFGEGKDQRLSARNTFVWGNLFVDNCHPDFALKDLDGRDEPWTTRPELIMPDVHEINTGNVSDYNIFYRSPGRPMPFWYGWHLTIFKDLAEWQSKTGNDKHSIIAQPLFVDAAKYDFRPAAGSPALDFVPPRMGNVYDYSGKLRPTRSKEKQPIRYPAGPFPFDDKK
jgi:parallel beta-helix repeat protein